MKEIREDDMETVHGGAITFLFATIVLNIVALATTATTLVCTQVKVNSEGKEIKNENGEPVRHCQ